jgi:hypothetical protein
VTNQLKGEAAFRIGGMTYTFNFGFEGLCEVEDAAKRPLPELLAEMGAKNGSPRMRTVGAFVYGGLRRHHPEIDFDTAGTMLMEHQPIIVEAMAKALQSALPADKASAEGKVVPETKPRRRGTG